MSHTQHAHGAFGAFLQAVKPDRGQSRTVGILTFAMARCDEGTTWHWSCRVRVIDRWNRFCLSAPLVFPVSPFRLESACLLAGCCWSSRVSALSGVLLSLRQDAHVLLVDKFEDMWQLIFAREVCTLGARLSTSELRCHSISDAFLAFQILQEKEGPLISVLTDMQQLGKRFKWFSCLSCVSLSVFPVNVFSYFSWRFLRLPLTKSEGLNWLIYILLITFFFAARYQLESSPEMQHLGLEKHQDFSKAQETTINYNIKYISNTWVVESPCPRTRRVFSE